MKKIVSIPLILILVITLVGVGYLAPIPVYALSAGGLRTTIASLILSLMLQSGAGVTNQEWLNTLNSSYGVESTIGTIEDCITNGLLSEVGGTLVDTGLSSAIESAPAWNSLGLSDIFATTSTDVGVTVASGGVNLANTAINVGTVGTIGAFAGAAGIGVGIGVLANHLYEKWKENVRVGAYINESNEIMNNIPANGGYCKVRYTNSLNQPISITDVYPEGVYGGCYILNSSFMTFNLYNTNNQAVTIKHDGGSSWSDATINAGSVYTSTVPNPDKVLSYHNYQLFNDFQEANDYFVNVKNGNAEIPKPKSPDLINKDGNLQMNNDNNSIGTGDQTNGSDMLPIPEDAYQDWVDQANDNTENGQTAEEQGQDFSDFIAPYLTGNPGQPSEPDQPAVDDPTRPNIPDQPEIPDKPDITQEELEEGLSLATSIDLKEVFPFCIPFDLLAILAVFRVTNREAPVIEFTFPDGNEIVLDFSIFDGVAGLMRTLELIAFVIGLAIVTRRIIGASG